MTRPEHEGQDCPVEEVIATFGRKWKSSILFHLKGPPLRFNKLRRKMPKITQRMLTQQLRELERDGLIHREQFPEVPIRVEYSLTAVGRSLEPILIAIDEWGQQERDSMQLARKEYDNR